MFKEATERANCRRIELETIGIVNLGRGKGGLGGVIVLAATVFQSRPWLRTQDLLMLRSAEREVDVPSIFESDGSVSGPCDPGMFPNVGEKQSVMQ